MEIIDSYTHCGLSKYEPIERVREAMHQSGVTRAVLVQHLGEFDNGYIQGVVSDDADHLVGVCLVNEEASDSAQQLQRWSESGHIRGVRFTTNALTRAPQLFGTAVELGLAQSHFCP